MAVRSGCLTQCPASLMRRCLIESVSLGRLLKRSVLLKRSFQETLRPALRILVYTPSKVFILGSEPPSLASVQQVTLNDGNKQTSLEVIIHVSLPYLVHAVKR